MITTDILPSQREGVCEGPAQRSTSVIQCVRPALDCARHDGRKMHSAAFSHIESDDHINFQALFAHNLYSDTLRCRWEKLLVNPTAEYRQRQTDLSQRRAGKMSGGKKSILTPSLPCIGTIFGLMW